MELRRRLERVILENPMFEWDWRKSREQRRAVHELFSTPIPPSANPKGGVSREVYYGFKEGCATANADMVVCTRLETGECAVLALHRDPGTPFGGVWDMGGGAILAYQAIADCLKAKSQKETGLTLEPEALLGCYRNDAPDMASSVIALCYVATAPVQQLQSVVAGDGNHKWQFFTLADLENLPANQTYWYAMYVWRKVLEAAPRVL